MADDALCRDELTCYIRGMVSYEGIPRQWWRDGDMISSDFIRLEDNYGVEAGVAVNNMLCGYLDFACMKGTGRGSIWSGSCVFLLSFHTCFDALDDT